MNILINQIFENKEAAALPELMESGGLPALISGLSAVHRANLAAALRDRLELPVFVICPDDTAAENFARDMSSMLGQEVKSLGMRDYTFYSAEAASRQSEQKRLSVLYALLAGTAPHPESLCSHENLSEAFPDFLQYKSSLAFTHRLCNLFCQLPLIL